MNRVMHWKNEKKMNYVARQQKVCYPLSLYVLHSGYIRA